MGCERRRPQAVGWFDQGRPHENRLFLKNIVLDPDPSNQAAGVATLDEVQTMMDKGMNTDEIMNALQSTPRRKQAEGGLSYLMGM